jgi:hypothetical protein
MERVEGMLRNLKLSEAERAGLKISGREMDIGEDAKATEAELKALVKILSEKLVSAEGLKQALGPIWCPIRGIRCTKKGENIFLVTFMQASSPCIMLDTRPIG